MYPKPLFLPPILSALLAGPVAAQTVIVSPEAEARHHGTRFEGARLELGVVNPVDGEYGPVAALHASLGTAFVPWIDFAPGIRWWRTDLDPDAADGRTGSLRSLSVHADCHVHAFRVAGLRPYLLTGVSVRHVGARVDGDPSLEDAISGFKAGLDTGVGLAGSGSGFGWRAEARREFVEDAGSWSWTVGLGWWPGKSARRPVTVTPPTAPPVSYPAWMVPTTPVPVPTTPAPATGATPEIESMLRQLVDDNRDLRARLDSLAAAVRPAPTPAPPSIPIPEPESPPPASVPATPAAPAPSAADASGLDDAMRELSFQLGPAGDVTKTWEGFRIRLGRRTSFASGGASLAPELQEDVRKVALVALRFPDARLIVEGHTDAAGSTARNLSLSEARAWSVAEELVRLGVERDRVSSQGLGSAVPIADNGTAEGRATNRRVEVRVLTRDGR